MTVITIDEINSEMKKAQENLNWLLEDDNDAFMSINTAKATIEEQEKLLKLIDNGGIASSTGLAYFFEDKNGKLYRANLIEKPYADMVVALDNGKKAWIKIERQDDESFAPSHKTLKRFGLHEVTVKFPVSYKLVGDDNGHATVEMVESKYNIVNGEQNKFWGMQYNY